MQTTGGRITVEIDGRRYFSRGSVKIMPTTVEVENGANMDGTGYSTIKPVLAKAELSFDSRLAIGQANLLSVINVTVREMDTGRMHLFTNARYSGRPNLDTEKGEISGLSIETDSYQVV